MKKMVTLFAAALISFPDSSFSQQVTADSPPMDSIPVSQRKSVNSHPVVKLAYFKKGEGCIAGFRRIGYESIDIKGCIKAANEARLPLPKMLTEQNDICCINDKNHS